MITRILADKNMHTTEKLVLLHLVSYGADRGFVACGANALSKYIHLSYRTCRTAIDALVDKSIIEEAPYKGGPVCKQYRITEFYLGHKNKAQLSAHEAACCLVESAALAVTCASEIAGRKPPKRLASLMVLLRFYLEDVFNYAHIIADNPKES